MSDLLVEVWDLVDEIGDLVQGMSDLFFEIRDLVNEVADLVQEMSDLFVEVRDLVDEVADLVHEMFDLLVEVRHLVQEMRDQGKRAIDDRFETIIRFMRRSFPSFVDLVLEPTGPASVYGSMVEKGRHAPIRASGISDGHMQMLFLLTALFSEGRQRTSIMLLDEPELLLPPWALAVLAEAVSLAAEEWNKQVVIATHSPVLLSQFNNEDCFAVELTDGRTRLRRVSELPDTKDLLEKYAIGSLYMAETIAPQSTLSEAGIPRDPESKDNG